MNSGQNKRPMRLAAGVAATAAVASLSACSGALVVEPAPYAGDPDCARVMLAIPDTLGGLELRATSSQATAAYGSEEPIIVRCGVEPPGPSTEACVATETATAAQDWLITEDDTDWTAVSFGRSPAVEVVIPKVRADQAVGELLAALSGAASRAPGNGLECR